MKDKTIYKLHSDICKALGHAIRIEIIDLLQNKELGFSELSETTQTLKSNLSQHLSVMVSKGILIQRKEGLNTFFKISSPKVTEACALMREVLIEQLQKSKEILKNL